MPETKVHWLCCPHLASILLQSATETFLSKIAVTAASASESVNGGIESGIVTETESGCGSCVICCADGDYASVIFFGRSGYASDLWSDRDLLCRRDRGRHLWNHPCSHQRLALG